MILTGIGSRKTSPEILDIMQAYTEKKKFKIMRSGGALGPDLKCEEVAARKNCKLEIYLPRPYFNGRRANGTSHIYVDLDKYKMAERLAQHLYPIVFPNEIIRQYMVRNVFQVTGLFKKESEIILSDLVFCNTPDGCTGIDSYTYGVTGGTGMAIMVADYFGVPILNLGNRKHLMEVKEFINAPRI